MKSAANEKRTLTDRMLKALKPAPAGKRYDVRDTVVPNLAIRVTDKGQRSFVLRCRYPGQDHAARRVLGDYGAINLADARTKARLWLELIAQGVDPQTREANARNATLRAQALTVAAVSEDFIRDKLPGERRGKDAERVLRREFLPAWGHRPIADITDLDIVIIINAKKRTAPGQARNVLSLAKRFFGWAVEQRVYGLKTSPAAGLKPGKIIGDKRTGDRVLNDSELFALWRATGCMRNPVGAVYRLLMLTGLRLNEVADAAWGEFDLSKKVWLIPKERMKGRNSKARAHAVPLTPDLLTILKGLPRFENGDFVFSTTFGASPIWVGSKIKDRLDARMLRTLRALARRRGDNPKKVALPDWCNHDIRRTFRTHLSRLRIAEEVREACLAHARPGIKGVYDLYGYLPEQKEALEMWAARLRSIVAPPPAADNVIRMPATV